MTLVIRARLGFLLVLAFAGSMALSAVPVGAQEPAGGSSDPKDSNFQIVPCTGVAERDGSGAVISGKDCDFSALIEMANRVIKFLLYLSIPFILGIIIFTAFKYLTANGNPAKLADAKHMLKYVFIGLVWILVSFILVYTVLDNLLTEDAKEEQQSFWGSYFKK